MVVKYWELYLWSKEKLVPMSWVICVKLEITCFAFWHFLHWIINILNARLFQRGYMSIYDLATVELPFIYKIFFFVVWLFLVWLLYSNTIEFFYCLIVKKCRIVSFPLFNSVDLDLGGGSRGHEGGRISSQKHWTEGCLHLLSLGTSDVLFELWTDPALNNLVLR